MKSSAIIGYTGFVGGNLCDQSQYTDYYNSKNIQEIEGKHYDTIVCAGIPAAMWLANNKPEQDLEQILQLTRLLGTCSCERFVLISTIAVYDAQQKGMNEQTEDMLESQLTYGKNRYVAEQEIARSFPKHHILRLPALFGPHIKKNFLYDLCNQEPAFLNAAAWSSLMEQLAAAQQELIKSYYLFNEQNGMYAFQKEKAAAHGQRAAILSLLQQYQCTALNFTHPESNYQFYDLRLLQGDIEKAIDADLRVLNLCSEPIAAKEIAKHFFDIDMELRGNPVLYDYDMQSLYAERYWGNSPWQYSKEQVMGQLRSFFQQQGIEL